MKKGIEAQSFMVATEMMELGVDKLRKQILSFGLHDHHPYHVLGSQMLAFPTVGFSLKTRQSASERCIWKYSRAARDIH
jgi:hypothetical protein